MLKVGITGGIGSGKSTACKVFTAIGIPVFYADPEAKLLMHTNPEIRKQLISTFGEAVYLPDSTINRNYLAGIVFSDANLLAKLNSIVHPAVRQAFEEWCLTKNTPYVLHEAAILFETGFNKLMDKTIAVVAKEEERIERVMKRDNIPSELVRERIKNQMSDEEKIKLADFVISNNEDELILPQIIEIDKILRIHG
jgi:dephospho-CoA kinase